MSQCSKCPLEVISHGILACSLPDDDVAMKVETDLLQRWGYPDDIIRVAGDRRSGLEKNGNQEIKSQPTDLKQEPDLRFEDTVTCVHKTDVKGLSEAGSEQSPSVSELYQQAEACYNSGKTQDSLIYINEALKTDGVHDNTMLLTLKVKTLNLLGNYAESLRSAAKVKVEIRSKELLVEGATALDNLDLLFTAEVWLKAAILDRSEEPEGMPWTQKAVHLFHSVRNKRIYRPLIKQSPVIVSVSGVGRGVYAKRMIAKGEIFSEQPEFLEQKLTSRVTACAHCGLSLVKPEDILIKGKLVTSELKKVIKKFWHKRVPTPCQVCNRVLYCSELCRNEAWHSYHKVICPSSLNAASAVLYDVRDSFRDVTAGNGFSWQGWWNAEFSPVLMARMWASMLTQAKLRTGDKVSPTMADWLAVLSQVEKFSSTCETKVSSSVPKTFELMKTIFKRSKFLRYEISEAEFNKKYHKISMNYINFQDVNNPAQHFLDKAKNDPKLFKKVRTYFKEPLPEAEFHGLFPLASCINHSCLPNAEIRSCLVYGKPGIVVASNRDISPFEEILISYVNPALGRKERRDMLMRRYRFWCQCSRCLFEGDGPDRCTQCGKWAAYVPVSKMSDPAREEMDYLQAVVNAKDTRDMQMFSERFESPGSTESPAEASECNSKSGRDHQGDLKGNADLENISITIDPEHEEMSGDMNCCGVSNHSDLHVGNRTHHDVLVSNTPRESPEKTNGQVDEISQVSEKETHGKKFLVLDVDNDVDNDANNDANNDINLKTDTGNKSGVGIKFPHCARCGRAWYCSQICQKDAWKKGHKKICRKF